MSDPGPPIEEARRSRPEARLIRYPRDAEIAAAEWLRFWGIVDARTHGPGADGGVDVESDQVYAQVKARVSPAGRPELQQLLGAATGAGRRPVFFSLGGFTQQAIRWASEVGMALFEFDLQGEPVAANGAAAELAGVELRMPVVASQEANDGADEWVLAEATAGSLPSPAPPDWAPVNQPRRFVKYARRLQRNGHRVTGYCVGDAAEPSDHELIAAWGAAGVFGKYVVVDHETGRVEGYRTWTEAYAATTAWDGGEMAPGVRRSLGRSSLWDEPNDQED